MSRDNARTIFTTAEFEQIEILVRQLEKAPADKQKSIRGKIRRIGLYWSEVASGKSYTVQNLQRLVDKAVIKVSDATKPGSQITKTKGRSGSDEYYIIGLCNEALGMKAEQQYKFPFLLGDSGRALPVDAYYHELNLVIEYYERQHTEDVKFFNRRMTVSGVSRGEQRKIYDERRKTELPKHGIKFVVISYTDFGTSKTLKREHDADLAVVKRLLRKNGIKTK
ncbi:hypothetical protein [Prevotella sp. Rep29]|uniref:hypothetical protein n=1 Tax=Prevotella sp. Rep29 TaxID=2691580 RepID=UPI001C6E6A89|nr:hypothetical protein [Prevotella sp. Rep29]QYR10121.1 hypothetical protein GRF55_02885 [Prevotella sp. Rep29]